MIPADRQGPSPSALVVAASRTVEILQPAPLPSYRGKRMAAACGATAAHGALASAAVVVGTAREPGRLGP